MLDQITPLILTYNEATNIGRTLEQLSWAAEIIVVDSFSTDDTLEILSSYPQVKLYQRAFDTHTNQWNYGLDLVKSEWVLSLDADYTLSKQLIAELGCLPKAAPIDSYFVRFKYCVFGKPLRGTLLPAREVLFRKAKAIYVDDGHTQLLKVEGQSQTLAAHIYHDDRKSLSRWLWAQDRYMLIEAKKLLDTPAVDLSFSDRLRKQKVLAPFVILLYCLLVHRGILDGWAGWYYAWQRMLAEILLSLHLIAHQQRVHES